MWHLNRPQHLVGEGGFEPPKLKAADLQSVPFGHSGTLPNILFAVDGKNDYSIVVLQCQANFIFFFKKILIIFLTKRFSYDILFRHSCWCSSVGRAADL